MAGDVRRSARGTSARAASVAVPEFLPGWDRILHPSAARRPPPRHDRRHRPRPTCGLGLPDACEPRDPHGAGRLALAPDRNSTGRYDWSSFLPMLRAARETGTQVLWDLLHYGWPDDLDIWRPASSIASPGSRPRQPAWSGTRPMRCRSTVR